MSGRRLVVWFVIVAGGLGLVGVVARWLSAPTVADLQETAAKLEIPVDWQPVEVDEREGFRELAACFASSCPSLRTTFLVEVPLTEVGPEVGRALSGTDEVEVPERCPAPSVDSDDSDEGAVLCSGFGRLDGRPVNVEVGTVASAARYDGEVTERVVIVTVGP